MRIVQTDQRYCVDYQANGALPETLKPPGGVFLFILSADNDPLVLHTFVAGNALGFARLSSLRYSLNSARTNSNASGDSSAAIASKWG